MCACVDERPIRRDCHDLGRDPAQRDSAADSDTTICRREAAGALNASMAAPFADRGLSGFHAPRCVPLECGWPPAENQAIVVPGGGGTRTTNGPLARAVWRAGSKSCGASCRYLRKSARSLPLLWIATTRPFRP